MARQGELLSVLRLSILLFVVLSIFLQLCMHYKLTLVEEKMGKKKVPHELQPSSQYEKKTAVISVDMNGDTKPTPPGVTLSSNTPSHRFPLYGTEAFSKLCPWTKPKESPSCSVLIKPRARENEGFAQWISNVVGAHIMVQQLGCQLLVDYGITVNVSEILLPHTGGMDWRVAKDFQCSLSNNCLHTIIPWQLKEYDKFSFHPHGLIEPPRYRSMFSLDQSAFDWYTANHAGLERKLPGFDLETAMACSLGSLFQLSPTASQFEPLLYTSLLPTLQSSYVISLYIRTHQAEPNNPRVASKEEASEQGGAKAIVECALHLEQEQPQGTNIVWLVVTDSPLLKEWVHDTYHNKDGGRQVLSSTSRGKHTKTADKPPTRDFSEAVIDWFLVGESDVVITSEWWSFGSTAALRTARPYYSFYSDGRAHRKSEKQCMRVPLVRGGGDFWNSKF